jgi:stress-induced morphogen
MANKIDNKLEMIRDKVLQSLPGADIVIEDMQGDGSHIGMDVIHPSFAGKTLVAQHQLVYQALGDMFKNELHALQLRTSAPIPISPK